MENNNNQVQNTENSENGINIRDLVFIVLNNWYWFVVSVLVCLIATAFIYKAQPKTYSAQGTILVRDDDNKRGYSKPNMDAILNNMGMQGAGMSLENEMYMLRSSWLMSQVIQRLDLNHYCSRNDLFKKVSYYKDAPIRLEMTDLKEDRKEGLGLRVSLKANNKYSYEETSGNR